MQDRVAGELDFSLESVFSRLRSGLRQKAPDGVHDDGLDPDCGDHDLNPGMSPGFLANSKRRAAVLVPLIERAGAVNVILTTRTEHLPTHAGQISFPGGKIDDADDSPLGAALREAHEEIGLDPVMAQPAGYLDLYETSTGFRIVPTVAVIAPDFIPVPEPGEVANVFEVPLAFLMNPANHQRGSREWQGKQRYFYAMPFGEHYIWGATAGIIRNLYNRTHKTLTDQERTLG